MKPTPELRFIERHKELFIDPDTNISHGVKLRVLQQWWAPFRKFHDGFGYTELELKGGEWRDVPLEAE